MAAIRRRNYTGSCKGGPFDRQTRTSYHRYWDAEGNVVPVARLVSMEDFVPHYAWHIENFWEWRPEPYSKQRNPSFEEYSSAQVGRGDNDLKGRFYFWGKCNGGPLDNEFLQSSYQACDENGQKIDMPMRPPYYYWDFTKEWWVWNPDQKPEDRTFDRDMLTEQVYRGFIVSGPQIGTKLVCTSKFASSPHFDQITEEEAKRRSSYYEFYKIDNKIGIWYFTQRTKPITALCIGGPLSGHYVSLDEHDYAREKTATYRIAAAITDKAVSDIEGSAILTYDLPIQFVRETGEILRIANSTKPSDELPTYRESYAYRDGLRIGPFWLWDDPAERFIWADKRDDELVPITDSLEKIKHLIPDAVDEVSKDTITKELRRHGLHIKDPDDISNKLSDITRFQANAAEWFVNMSRMQFEDPEDDSLKAVNFRKARMRRFVEEACEYAQTRLSTLDILDTAKYALSRPVGRPSQEVGGILTTLAVSCESEGLNMISCGIDELVRITKKIPEIRAKDMQKPKGVSDDIKQSDACNQIINWVKSFDLDAPPPGVTLRIIDRKIQISICNTDIALSAASASFTGDGKLVLSSVSLPFEDIAISPKIKLGNLKKRSAKPYDYRDSRAQDEDED